MLLPERVSRGPRCVVRTGAGRGHRGRAVAEVPEGRATQVPLVESLLRGAPVLAGAEDTPGSPWVRCGRGGPRGVRGRVPERVGATANLSQ